MAVEACELDRQEAQYLAHLLPVFFVLGSNAYLPIVPTCSPSSKQRRA